MPAPRLGTRSLALFLSFSRLFSPSLTLSPPLSLFSLFFFLLLSPPLPHTLAASLRSHVPPRLLLRYENQQMNIQQQSFNMEQQNYAISSLQDTKATVEAMKGAAKQMKKEMKTINIDNVEDLQMEMEDLLEDSNEIQEVRRRAMTLICVPGLQRPVAHTHQACLPAPPPSVRCGCGQPIPTYVDRLVAFLFTALFYYYYFPAACRSFARSLRTPLAAWTCWGEGGGCLCCADLC